VTRKEVGQILSSLGIENKFSLQTVDFSDLTRKVAQVVTIKHWEPNRAKYDAIKQAFRGTGLIVDFA